MRRLLLLIGLIVLATPRTALAAASNSQDGPPPVEPGTETELVGTSLILTAAAPGSLEITQTPGGTWSGPRVYCGWFDISVSGADFGVYEVVYGEIGETYLFNCWITAPWDDPLPNYPIVAVFTDPNDPPPGDVITAPVAAQFAVGSINFEPPTVDLNPTGEQIVGVPSWLAVTSALDYAEVSAQAGPVWATVRPEFRDVTWNLGNGDELICTTDAATVWDPDGGSEQTSDCVYTYESGSADGTFPAEATVTWTVRQQTNETNGNWVEWGTVSLTTPFAIEVTELQAAII